MPSWTVPTCLHRGADIQYASFHKWGPPRPSTLEASLNIVTFNLRYGTANDGINHWELRRELLLGTIASLKPDILGVQECEPFQGDEISMRFPHLGRFGLGRYHGVSVDRPHEAFSGEHCDIFFDSGRYRVRQCGTCWHSETPDAPASISWKNSLARITTWGVFDDLRDGNQFAVFNTHLDWGEPYLAKATKQLAEHTARVRKDYPLVLMGDFNAIPGSKPYNRLTRSGNKGVGLIDVWVALGNTEENAGTYHGFSGVPDKRIDWILASPEFTAASIEVCRADADGRYPSDHFPLAAQLSIRI